jgi:diguanylate cyclase (GGDEF)-like protein
MGCGRGGADAARRREFTRIDGCADNGRVGSRASVSPHKPFVPLLAGGALAIVAAVTLHLSAHGPVFLFGAAGALAAPFVALLLPAHLRLARRTVWVASIPLLTLMQADSGGVASPYAALVVVGIAWVALLSDERDAVVTLPVVIACCLLPMLVVGGPAYPVSWSRAAVLLLVAVTVCLAFGASAREAGRSAERLRRGSVVDPLSGLLNPRGWELVARPALERCQRSGVGAVLVMVKLDRSELRRPEPSEGFDVVRRRMAEALRSTLRGGDVLARLGADSFVALLADASGPDGREALARIRASAESVAAFSAGLAVDEGGRLEQLMAYAEAQLRPADRDSGRRTQIARARRPTVIA